MRILGIDYGEKRVGLAISDEAEGFAFPLQVIQNTENLISEISSICHEKEVGRIVVGESKNYKMEDNAIMADVRIFVDNLQKETGLPVTLHPEFLSSAEAERLQGKNDMLDASSATIILKSYLETNKNKNNE